MRVMVAAGYDDLTREMQKWLSDTYSKLEGIEPLFGESASRSRLLSIIRESEDGLVLIFFGHGDPVALLTAAHLGAEPFCKRGSRLCTADDLVETLSVQVFAYCCSSSADLGERVRRAGADNRFLGYRGEIPFSTALAEVDAFKRPVMGVVSSILEAGEIDPREVIADLLDGYRREHERWLRGDLSEEDRSMLICMCLEEHVRLLDRRVGG